MIKAYIKTVVLMVIIFLSLGDFTCRASSEDASFETSAVEVSGLIITLDGSARAYKEPDTSSEVVIEFKEGESIYKTGESGDFYTIFYKGETLYIMVDEVSQESIASSEASADAQAEAVASEMKNQEKEDTLAFEREEKRIERDRNALIWKIVIAVLVVSIITVSIIIAVRNNRKAIEDSDKEWN